MPPSHEAKVSIPKHRSICQGINELKPVEPESEIVGEMVETLPKQVDCSKLHVLI